MTKGYLLVILFKRSSRVCRFYYCYYYVYLICAISLPCTLPNSSCLSLGTQLKIFGFQHRSTTNQWWSMSLDGNVHGLLHYASQRDKKGGQIYLQNWGNEQLAFNYKYVYHFQLNMIHPWYILIKNLERNGVVGKIRCAIQRYWGRSSFSISFHSNITW